MKRMIVLSLLVVTSALSLVVTAQQQPAAPKVLEVTKLKDNLFVLKGGGGNTAVFIMADGVTVVDAKNPGWGQPILDKIKELTDKPVVRLINTHTHADHVSGNVEFPATIDIVTQENTKANMEKMVALSAMAGSMRRAGGVTKFSAANDRVMLCAKVNELTTISRRRTDPPSSSRPTRKSRWSGPIRMCLIPAGTNLRITAKTPCREPTKYSSWAWLWSRIACEVRAPSS